MEGKRVGASSAGGYLQRAYKWPRERLLSCHYLCHTSGRRGLRARFNKLRASDGIWRASDNVRGADTVAPVESMQRKENLRRPASLSRSARLLSPGNGQVVHTLCTGTVGSRCGFLEDRAHAPIDGGIGGDV